MKFNFLSRNGISVLFLFFAHLFNPEYTFAQNDGIKTHEIIELQLLCDSLYRIGKFEKAISIADSIINNTSPKIEQSHYAEALLIKAKILWRYGDNLKATENIQESLQVFENLKDDKNLSIAMSMLADIYVSMKNLDEAQYLYNELLDKAKESNDSSGMAMAYEHLGVIYFFREDYKNAIAEYSRALAINLNINDTLAAALNNSNIAESCLLLKQYDKALELLLSSKPILEKRNFYSGLIFLHYTLGKVYFSKSEYKLAHLEYQKSLDYIKITGEKREEGYIVNLMSENFAAQGNYREAYQLANNYIYKRDSAEAAENDLRLEELQTRYQLEQRDKRNEQLKLQNKEAQMKIRANEKLIFTQYITGGIILVLLFIVAINGLVLRRKKSQLARANNTKDKLFSIIGHDLNGSVQNIASLTKLLELEHESESSEVFEQLKKTSNKLSVLVRDLFSWSISQTKGLDFNPTRLNLNEIIKDSEELLNYAIHEKSLVIDNQINKETQVYGDRNAVSTIIRNILSNTIKFSPYKSSIKISSQLVKVEGKPFCKISFSDEGEGFKSELIDQIINSNSWKSSLGTSNEKGSGFGFTLIKEFVKKSEGELEITNNEKGGGLVSITLPINYS